MLANHLVSIGGTRATSDVDSTFLQPFLSYVTQTRTTCALNTESTYDGENNKWTVPLNLTVKQLLKLGDQRMQFDIGPKLYVGPTSARDWGIRFTYTHLLPTG